jgi:deoxycytidine triphosphate deaminase/intein/homing endonuclease
MGVLADWQILREIKIEPFAESALRPGVISYGVSSYGYDVRVGRHFKVFTNARCAVVDPKNFDPKSFVDIEGDFCLIPPNSFALAETIEYLEIPRDILGICVGKSTYARCFRGDTRVALVDGSAPTLEEMARRSEDGEMFWGYSIGPHGRLMVTSLEQTRYIGRDALQEIVLDNGEPIFCTPDHLFLRRDGRMVEADQLRPGDSLMPLYRQIARGYEIVYQPLNGHLEPTHRLADEWNLRHQIYPDTPGTHRHHVDHDRRNNRPWNIVRMEASEHIRHHNAENYGEEFDPDEHSAAIRAALAALMKDPEWRKRYSLTQRERAMQFWHAEEYAEIRARVLLQRQNISEETREAHRQAMLRRLRDPAERERQARLVRAAWAKDDGSRRRKQAEVARTIRLREEITEERILAALHETGSIRGAARLLNCDRSVFRRFPGLIDAFRGRRRQRNHKVASIRSLPGIHDVYCLTVPEAGNFALEAGVFVHNCGIICNVTPLEPEWRGKITIEISNTTPLPAKIYAGEGIAQIVFLRGEAVCHTSYGDKRGKYQDQKGLTLPFVVGAEPAK